MTEEQGERRDEAVPADEDVVAREESAAAAEAGSIGGRRDPSADEGHYPPVEAGETEAADPQAEYAEPDQLGSTAREEEPPDEPEE